MKKISREMLNRANARELCNYSEEEDESENNKSRIDNESQSQPVLNVMNKSAPQNDH